MKHENMLSYIFYVLYKARYCAQEDISIVFSTGNKWNNISLVNTKRKNTSYTFFKKKILKFFLFKLKFKFVP